jgi:hypothetical protein
MDKIAISAFENVSFGTVIMYTIAILFVGAAVYKFLERYRVLRNDNEEKDKKIELHSEQISTLAAKIDNVVTKLDYCVKAIDTVKTEATEREARRLRKGILQFADNLRSGSKPSIDMYREIFESNKEYLSIVERTGLKNGFTEREMEYIEQNYKEDYCS